VKGRGSDLGSVTLELQQASGLQGDWNPSGLTPEIAPDGNGHSRYRFEIPRDTAEKVKFFRIRVIAPE